MTFSPGVLSTWKPLPSSDLDPIFKFEIGDVWESPQGLAGQVAGSIVAPLNVKDLACPTWGLGIPSTSADGTVVTTIGPPWLPLIIPPIEVFSLDPTWASRCTGLLTDPFNMNTFILYDPPIALTRVSGLVPAPVGPVVAPTLMPAPNNADPTTMPERSIAPSSTAAKPAISPMDPADPPARTGYPGQDSSIPSLGLASGGPAIPASPPGDPIATPTIQSDPPADPKVSQPATPAISAVGVKDPPADPNLSSSHATNLLYGGAQLVPTNHKAPTQPDPQRDDPQSQAQGLGALIYGAFGNSGPVSDDAANGLNTISVSSTDVQNINVGGGQVIPVAPDYLKIAGQTVVPNPTGMVVAGFTIVPGGNAFTLSNTPISLGPSGALVIGSTTISLTALSPTPLVLSALTVAGQTFTPNPTAFPVASTTISAGGPAVTIGGTIVSLQSSGTLIVGSSMIALSATSTPPTNKVFTVASQTFIANPTAFSIAGTTISAGSPAITIAGTTISLQSSGALLIGSSTIPLLAPQTPIPSLLNINGLEIEAQSSIIIVDDVKISPGAPGVTINGTVVSLEAAGATLDVGTGRFALKPTGVVGNASGGFAVFEGGQRRGLELSLLLLFGVGGTVMTLML